MGKSNVISVRDLVRQALFLFRERLWTLIGIIAIPAFLSLVIGFGSVTLPSGKGTITLFAVLGVFALAFLQILAGIAIIRAVGDSEKREITTYFREAFPLFLSFLWVSILVGFLEVVGFILLIIPGIIISVYLSLAVFIVLFESERGVDALKKSHSYVKGRWWAVFGRMLVIILISGILGGIGAFFSSKDAALGQVISVVIQILVVPFSVAYMYFLYTSVKESAVK